MSLPKAGSSPSPEWRHGSLDLPSVEVTSYNLELREHGGFLGDKASETAFRALLDEWRRSFAGGGRDPFGSTPTREIGREELDETLREGDAAAVDILEGAAEAFSHELTGVLRRFLSVPAWRGVQRIVCGGGFQSSDVGQAIVRRASALLEPQVGVSLCTLDHDPDDGGMVGWVHAAPRALLVDADALLAVDVGGTNLRCGVVMLDREASDDGSKSSVRTREKWCHADDEPTRDEVVTALADMLVDMAAKAEADGIRLAPVVGLSCPGIILPDGRIDHGAQNLPGDWTDEDFHLPLRVADLLSDRSGAAPAVLIHNDAVIQGLSERPLMSDVERWGAVTIGTGLGNCSFRNR